MAHTSSPTSAYDIGSSCIHRPVAAKGYPAPNDPVHKPEPDQDHRQPCDEDTDPKGQDGEGYTERDPEQSEPECSDLPSKVRFEPCTSCLASLEVVQNDRDDRRPAGEERSYHGCSPDDTGQQAERMQRVHNVSPGDEGIRRSLHADLY